MKNTRSTLVVAASLLPALFSVLPVSSAFAQPPAKTVGAKGKGAKGAKTPKVKGMTKRILTAIEAKTGKALTPDQKTRLADAYRTRQAALDAADAQLATQGTAITGLSAEDWAAIVKPGRKKGTEGAMGTATTGK